MNILHVVQLYYPVATGAARLFMEIGERLSREGHRVTVLTTDAYDLEHVWARGKRRIELANEQNHGVSIQRLPLRRLPGPPIVYPIIRRLMVEASRLPGTTPLLRGMATLTPRMHGLDHFLRSAAHQRYDVIHTTNISLDFAIIPFQRFAKRHRIPFLCTPLVHMGVPGDTTILRYYSMPHQIDLLKRSDRVITMTGIESDFLAGAGVPHDRLRQIGVGITPAEVQGGNAARFRREHGITGDLVLTIGAMAYDKGTIHVVEAMRKLWSQGVEAHLALIGAPLEQFTTFYKQLPADVRSRIILLPYAPDRVKRDALAAANLMALPSRTDSFGIVYPEAWCYQIPVIGARAGGVPDVIDHERDGLLVPFGDVPALADAIARLLRDRAEAGRMGEAGYAKVMTELTWERKYAQVRSVYEEVTSEPHIVGGLRRT